MPSENTKYLVHKKGGPLIITTIAKPTTIEPSEVMIRVKAIAINPADCKMIDQGLRVTSWPFVAGLDGAGVVEAVGDDVKKFACGDEVLALFTAPSDCAGSFQKFAVVREEKVAKKPAMWSFEEAATIGTCYLTAIAALGCGIKTSLPFLNNGPTANFSPSSVLILGGSSSLGAATIQLLRLVIPDCTILATSSPKHHNHITNTLGANAAFDRNSTSLISDIKAASSGSRGVDAIIDAVGAGCSERGIFDVFDEVGSKRYAQVWTGLEEIKVPSGVDSILFRASMVSEIQGGKNIMLALQNLLEHGKYQLPLPVRRVGEGVQGLEAGLDMMRKGVSGEKLVVVV